jgi:hypothetical protein
MLRLIDSPQKETQKAGQNDEQNGYALLWHHSTPLSKIYFLQHHGAKEIPPIQFFKTDSPPIGFSSEKPAYSRAANDSYQSVTFCLTILKPCS